MLTGQVGDRLIPIGYTSSRAPGTADFSMSIPQQDENGSRRQRRGTRERDLEEVGRVRVTLFPVFAVEAALTLSSS